MRLRKNRIHTPDRLERRELLSAVVVESEPNDRKTTADVAALDPADQAASLVGRIANADDRDFYRFTAPASGAVHIEVRSGSGLTGQVSVEDARGVKKFESEPRDGVNSGDFNVTAGTTYFVRVRGKDKSTGDYRVSVDLNPSAPAATATAADVTAQAVTIVNESEPNNRAREADFAPLSTVNTTRLRGVSTSSNDKDFFVVRPQQAGTLNLRVYGPAGNVAKLEVTNVLGTTLFQTEPNNGVNSGSVHVNANQILYIRVRASGSASSAYAVDAALTADPTPASAALDEAIGAVALAARAGNASQTSVKLEGALTASSVVPLASGKATYEARSDRTKLSVEVEDLRNVQNVQVRVNGAVVGTARVNALGTADLNLDSRLGAAVPKLSAGALVQVYNAATGQLLVSGSLRSR